MSTLALNPSLQALPPAPPVAAPASVARHSAEPSRRGWEPAPARRGALAATLAMHLLGALALLQAGRTVLAQQRPAPIQVRVLDVQAPAPQAPAPPAKVQLPHQLLPLTQTPQPLPLPEFEMVAPATRVLPAPAQAAPAQSPAPITASTIEATQSAAPAPQPKAVASSALRYRVEPAVELPLLSRRAGEQGRVGLRVVFDTQGRPRDIQLQRSSGFARLDAQALVAMQAARIQPYQEAGRTIEVLALAWLEYELD